MMVFSEWVKGRREIAKEKVRRKFGFNEGNLSERMKWNVYVSAAVPARWFCWCCYCSMLLVHALENSKNRKSKSMCVFVEWVLGGD